MEGQCLQVGPRKAGTPAGVQDLCVLKPVVSAWQALKIFESIPYQEVAIDLEASLELALRNEIYAYNAYYLSAAKSHRVELVTLDQKMLEVARKEGIKVRKLK